MAAVILLTCVAGARVAGEGSLAAGGTGLAVRRGPRARRAGLRAGWGNLVKFINFFSYPRRSERYCRISLYCRGRPNL